MSIEAMKLALEALEAYRPVIVKRHGLTYSVGDKAITALRQAIEQAEQAQPVDWEAVAAEQAMTIAMMKAEQAQPVAYPHEEMQDEILRLSEIISTSAFYQAGHADALEWAAQMAVLEDPRTSDWVYDDRHDLEKALRKGPDFLPSPPPRQPLTGDRVKELLTEAGYDSAHIQARAGFINGLRHGEAAHGIKGEA